MATTVATGLSVEEFLEGDHPPGAELIDGEVIVNDPTFWHQEIAKRILVALHLWVGSDEGRGRAGFGGNWAIGDQLLKPDAWWTAHERAPELASTRSDTPPDLVVEVRSPSTWLLDLGPKRAAYERAGVRELWLVDTPARSVLVYRDDEAVEVGPGGELTTPLLPGFTLALDELFD